MFNARKCTFGKVIIYALLAISMLIGFSVSANSGIEGNQSAAGVLLLAQGDTCIGKCEKAKEACMAQNTVTNNYGVKMVTPDGAKRCWAAYHLAVTHTGRPVSQ